MTKILIKSGVGIIVLYVVAAATWLLVSLAMSDVADARSSGGWGHGGRSYSGRGFGHGAYYQPHVNYRRSNFQHSTIRNRSGYRDRRADRKREPRWPESRRPRHWDPHLPKRENWGTPKTDPAIHGRARSVWQNPWRHARAGSAAGSPWPPKIGGDGKNGDDKNGAGHMKWPPRLPPHLPPPPQPTGPQIPVYNGPVNHEPPRDDGPVIYEPKIQQAVRIPAPAPTAPVRRPAPVASIAAHRPERDRQRPPEFAPRPQPGRGPDPRRPTEHGRG